jgi:hypothetical protein
MIERTLRRTPMARLARPPADKLSKKFPVEATPIFIRLEDPAIKCLPDDCKVATVLDIRGTSIMQLPPGTEFLHLRTDHFAWSPQQRMLIIASRLPTAMLSSLPGKKVGMVIVHPLLCQLGVDSRYLREVKQIGDCLVCKVVKRKPKII